MQFMGVVNIESRSNRSGDILGGHEAMMMGRSIRWLWHRKRGKKEEQVVVRVFRLRSLNALMSY